jgi:hypothetical protein
MTETTFRLFAQSATTGRVQGKGVKANERRREMKLSEAIEKLKWLGEQISPSPIKEAIDTVVAELEKTTYTAEDMVDFHRWMKEGIYKNKVGIRFNGEFVKYIEGIPVTLSNEQVIKLWEKQK